MVLFHESVVVSADFPQIKRGVLVFFIRAQQRVAPQKTGLLHGLFLPHPAIPDVNRDILLFDSKKDFVNKHLSRIEQFPGLFSDNAIGGQAMQSLESLDGGLGFLAHPSIRRTRIKTGFV